LDDPPGLPRQIAQAEFQSTIGETVQIEAVRNGFIATFPMSTKTTMGASRTALVFASRAHLLAWLEGHFMPTIGEQQQERTYTPGHL
jgi:hypothetical protein